MRILHTYTEYVEPEPLTEAEILALCCEVVPVDPCSETGKVSVYDGADAEHRNFDEQEALRAARAAHPSKRILSVRSEAIGPPPGMPCGHLYETWVGRNNCCEGVPAIRWEDDYTPDVLPAGGSIVIAWTGGTGGETTVTTSSNATWFDDGRKIATGYGWSIELFAGETFCGVTAVTVSDGCSVDTMLVRSDQGQWVYLGPVCYLAGENGVAEAVPGTSSYWNVVADNGQYRTVESQSFVTSNYTAAQGYRAHVSRPCNEGGCSDPWVCRVVTSTWEAMVAATYRECNPGIFPGSDRPCLNAAILGQPAGVITEIIHAGTVWEWAVSAGYNSMGTCCGVGSGGTVPYQQKTYVRRGAGGVGSWRWEC